jgi:hypothetical protein
VDHGIARIDRLAPPASGVDPAVFAFLPVERRLGAGVLHEGDIRAVRDGGSIDLEGVELDRVSRPLVVVGEAAAGGADLVLTSLDYEHPPLPGRTCPRYPGRTAFGLNLRGQLVSLDQLQQLQHRLVVLQLVREQHLVDEAVPQQRILDIRTDLHALQYVERARADVFHVGTQLRVAQDRQLAANLARVLDRVVEAAQLPVQRLPPADRLHQPQLLEVGDVPEVPGQGTQDRRVDSVQLLVVERRDQRQRPLTRLGESVRDRCLRLGGDFDGDP